MRLKSPDVLREREFRLLFAGQTVSLFGDALLPVALAFAVLRLTGSATDLGIVLAAQMVPLAAFLLLGGVWADRLPRHAVMLVADVVRAAAQGLLALLLFAGDAQIWQLVALQFAYGTAQAFFDPASTGLVPQTVPAARLQQANALLNTARSGTGILGPIVAGALLATVGPAPAFAANAATFVVSAAFLAAMRPRVAGARAERETLLQELRGGWREFSSRTWLWVSVAFFGVYHLAVLGPYFVLGPLVAEQSLGGASAWATILAAAGIGNVLGGLVSFRVRLERPLLASYVFTLFAVPAIALLAIPAPLLSIAAAALVARVAMAFFGTVWYTALQEHVPSNAISRVSSYDWLGSVLLFPLGLALAGPLAAELGVSATLWLSTGVFAAATLAALSVPSIRTLGAAPAAAQVPPLAPSEREAAVGT